MRTACIISVTALLLAATACGSTTLPSSSLTIRHAVTDALISAPTAMGTLTVNVGATEQIKVVRSFRTDEGNTFSDEVTQFTNFKWESGGSAANIDQLGHITGVAAGNEVLEAKFRESPFDPWDICRLQVVVN
jgi:hypothetical protein